MSTVIRETFVRDATKQEVAEAMLEVAMKHGAQVDLCDAAICLSEHPLGVVLGDALEQAVGGKGEERHGKGRPFFEQPWVELYRVHGLGFLTGQAHKKMIEAQSNYEDWDHNRWRTEMLGAIVYLSIAVLAEDLASALETGEIRDEELCHRLGVEPLPGVTEPSVDG